MSSVIVGGENRKVSLAVLAKEEKESIGGFSEPSKMPWFSYSIPARHCQTGKRLHEVPGSVCHGCYALKGRYVFGNVQNALEKRFALMMGDFEEWAENMTAHLLERASRFIPSDTDKFPAFRWHDSGDIQSEEHLEAIVYIATMTQDIPMGDGTIGDIEHWLPSREYGIIQGWLDKGNSLPRNLNIRISAHMVDGPVPIKLARRYGLTVSSVNTDKENYPEANHCPAYGQGGQCKECRSCWDRDVFHVSYPAH